MISHQRDPMSAGSSRDGFIIIAVLWMLIALATLASIYSVYIANTAMALSVSDDALQAELLVNASLELTSYRFSSAKDAQNPGGPGGPGAPGVPGRPKVNVPSRGGFSFRAGAASVGVTFVSEAARIDLNEAPMPMLAGLFAAFGVKSEDAVEYANRIIGWRDPPKEGAAKEGAAKEGAAKEGAAKEGAAFDEEGLYRSAGLKYPPRGGPFPHVDELRLVYGLPPALIDRILPFVTVYSGLAKVNVLDAAPEVIAALPGMTPGVLNAFLDKRESGPVDEQSLPRLLGPSQEGATLDPSAAYRVQVRIAFDNGRQVYTEAVILTGTTEAPYHVLYWRDDAGNGPGQLRAGVGLR
jgi:general secretion pathway protein K